MATAWLRQMAGARAFLFGCETHHTWRGHPLLHSSLSLPLTAEWKPDRPLHNYGMHQNCTYPPFTSMLLSVCFHPSVAERRGVSVSGPTSSQDHIEFHWAVTRESWYVDRAGPGAAAQRSCWMCRDSPDALSFCLPLQGKVCRLELFCKHKMLPKEARGCWLS